MESLGVWLYHQLTGESNWNNPSLLVDGLPEIYDQYFKVIIRQLLRKDYEVELDFLESALNGIRSDIEHDHGGFVEEEEEEEIFF